MLLGWTARRWGLTVLALIVLAVIADAAWVSFRAGQARAAVTSAKSDAQQLKGQLEAYDFVAAAATMTQLRQHADKARDISGDPAWRVASWMPIVGRNAGAARTVSATVAGVADAAEPLETALPQLQPETLKANGGKVNVAALQTIANAIPQVSDAVIKADNQVNDINVAHLSGQLSQGIITLRELLGVVRGPMESATPTLKVLPEMLGSKGQQNWLVLFEQDAEARGTGGLVGSYATLHTDNGKISLDKTASRQTLDKGAKIPLTGINSDLQDLWGSDLSEWAGLNLSPNYPWTGQLVNAGWKARGGKPDINYVLAVDQYVVAALLKATGPVTVQGVHIDSDNAVGFLSKGVYARFPNNQTVDAVTNELVQTVFAKFTSGQFQLPALISAIKDPVSERRLLVWSADQAQEDALTKLPVGGQIPDTPGPFAMAVVNNGGGNKLDAYLHVTTAYTPGKCNQGVRIGRIDVTLSSTAPTTGLPSYVTERNDSRDLSKAHVPKGSNEELLDIYGPVNADAPLITVDGKEDDQIVQGLDRGHTVWRVRVPIDPGQTRTVSATIVVSVDPHESDTATVMAQPMVNPAQVSAGPVPDCVG